MDAHQHTPNPYDSARINRRDALLGIAGLATLVAVAELADKARSFITRMTPEQREYLQGMAATKISWIDIPSETHGESRWMAKHSDGSSITVALLRTHKGEFRSIQVSDSAKPFTYKCPDYRHSVHDQPVIDKLLATLPTATK